MLRHRLRRAVRLNDDGRVTMNPLETTPPAATPLTTVVGDYGHTQALRSGTVPAAVSLRFEDVPAIIQAFRRMVRGLEFDVCEMAATTYLCAKEHGVAFTALPIFVVRGFHHGAIMVNTSAGIGHPRDLEGRRVGVNRGYTVTTGVWARGILADEYGVDLDRVEWARSGDEHVATYTAPPNVVDLPGADLAAMVTSGELDAVVGVDVSGPSVAPLIADPAEAALAALRERGLYPINHLIVVRDDVLAADPGLAPALVEAFAAAKAFYLDGLTSVVDPTPIDRRNQLVADVIGDPVPYGMSANRAVLDTLVDYAVAQHILTRRPALDELFAAGTLDG